MTAARLSAVPAAGERKSMKSDAIRAALELGWILYE
jgi:hypothetical protein